jgi:hypothetical protein
MEIGSYSFSISNAPSVQEQPDALSITARTQAQPLAISRDLTRLFENH